MRNQSAFECLPVQKHQGVSIPREALMLKKSFRELLEQVQSPGFQELDNAAIDC